MFNFNLFKKRRPKLKSLVNSYHFMESREICDYFSQYGKIFREWTLQGILGDTVFERVQSFERFYWLHANHLRDKTPRAFIPVMFCLKALDCRRYLPGTIQAPTNLMLRATNHHLGEYLEL